MNDVKTLGLGSSVALWAYDPVTKVGGMAHMVLPERSANGASGLSPKFVDCAIPMLFEEMRAPKPQVKTAPTLCSESRWSAIGVRKSGLHARPPSL